jgi:TRAP-type C4-dicarboxylate transport system permease small subunit
VRGLRRALDALYLAGGIAGALALFAIAAIIGAQIVSRELNTVFAGADDLTAYSVAASAMLPLAYAFRHGAHIRVDLVIGNLRGAARFAMETLVLALALAIAAMLAYALGDLAHDSWLFDDVAQGTVPWKLWIPQAMAAAGAALLAVSLLDDLVVHVSGGVPSYRRAAEASALERAGEEI